MAHQLVARGFETQVNAFKGVKGVNGSKDVKGVSAHAVKAVYLALLYRANKDTLECYPSLDDLARVTQVNRNSVNGAIKQLVADGFIEYKRTRSSNKYLIVESRLTVSDGVRGSCSAESEGLTQESEGLTPQSQRVLPEPNNEPNNEPNKEPERRAHSIPDDFSVNKELREWFTKKGFQFDIEEATEDFVLYYKGTGGKKKNWLATWQRWMNKQRSGFTNKHKKKPQSENFRSKDYGTSDNLEF